MVLDNTHFKFIVFRVTFLRQVLQLTSLEFDLKYLVLSPRLKSISQNDVADHLTHFGCMLLFLKFSMLIQTILPNFVHCLLRI